MKRGVKQLLIVESGTERVISSGPPRIGNCWGTFSSSENPWKFLLWSLTFTGIVPLSVHSNVHT